MHQVIVSVLVVFNLPSLDAHFQIAQGILVAVQKGLAQ